MTLPNLGRRGSNQPPAFEARMVDIERAVARLGSRVLVGAGGATIRRVLFPAHGVSVGTWVKDLASTWSVAQASSTFTADVVGVVTTVVDSDTIDVAIAGDVQLLGTSFTAWTTYWLSTTSGVATSTRPTAPTVAQPLFTALYDGWIHLGPTLAVARSARLSELLDATITSPATGDRLKWDGSAWVNAVTPLSDLSNVTLTSPTNGDVLTYQSGVWINRAPTTISVPVSVANGGTAKTGITANTFWYASATDTLAEATITAFGRSLVACADAAAGRTQLGLGTLATISSPLPVANGGTAKTGITADTFWYASASNVLAEASITSFGRSFVAAANAAAGTALLSTMVASGASHAAGLAPDPPAVAGTTKFLREDATWAVPSGGSSVTGSVNRVSSGSQTITSGTSNVTVSSGWAAVGTPTLSGFDTSTGIFTTPSDGLYLITAYLSVSYGAGGSQAFDFYVDYNNASSPNTTLGRFTPYNFNSNLSPPWGGMSGMKFLTTGDTLRLRLSNLGANTLTIAEAHFNIAKLG